MTKVFSQPYTKVVDNKKVEVEISSFYGKPGKTHFKHDCIRLCVSDGDDIWMTPDEAATIIRALSAGLAHFLVGGKAYSHIIKSKEINP